FFDMHFAQEIEEHSTRMRELISGRDVSVDTGITWGASDAADDYVAEGKREANAGGANRSAAAAGAKAWAPQRSDTEPPLDAGSLLPAVDDLEDGSRVDDDDEMPAEKTRIETNPLEKISELDRLASLTPKPTPVAPKPPPSGPSPLPPAPLPV